MEKGEDKKAKREEKKINRFCGVEMCTSMRETSHLSWTSSSSQAFKFTTTSPLSLILKKGLKRIENKSVWLIILCVLFLDGA